MKQLTCEMCGGTDLIKEDGIFVCQTCGCKYSVEEAKRMMVEGTVDVQGTVKVDNSAFVEKYLANARRAKEKEDWEETEKYYNMVEQNDPSNIEAIFYSSYGKAKSTLVDADLYKRQAAFISDSFAIEDLSKDGKEDSRTVMRFSPALAPIKAAVFPLTKDHREKAMDIYCQLAKSFDVQYDESGSIGKRYRRQDAIGTPLCITVDNETIENGTVTVRERDSMQQIVLKVEELESYIANLIKF